MHLALIALILIIALGLLYEFLTMVAILVFIYAILDELNDIFTNLFD